MKKPKSRVEDTQLDKPADIVPTSGYAMIVDGQFKTVH
ncbi:hypothetical protein ABIE89_000481 [Bradyrhizobium niftali]